MSAIRFPLSRHSRLAQRLSGSARSRLIAELIMPAALLGLLVLLPPHGLDLSVAHAFFRDGVFPWKESSAFEFWTHQVPKYLPAMIAAFALVTAAIMKRRGATLAALRRPLYIVSSMVIALIGVWWLKRTTGVACPWDLTAFGGTASLTDPMLSLKALSGNCWPAGHAGTGFCLFGLYFALKDIAPKTARLVFLCVTVFGLYCGLARVMQGAHFVSHVIASGLIDWLVAAVLYRMMLASRPRPVLKTRVLLQGGTC